MRKVCECDRVYFTRESYKISKWEFIIWNAGATCACMMQAILSFSNYWHFVGNFVPATFIFCAFLLYGSYILFVHFPLPFFPLARLASSSQSRFYAMKNKFDKTKIYAVVFRFRYFRKPIDCQYTYLIFKNVRSHPNI